MVWHTPPSKPHKQGTSNADVGKATMKRIKVNDGSKDEEGNETGGKGGKEHFLTKMTILGARELEVYVLKYTCMQLTSRPAP